MEVNIAGAAQANRDGMKQCVGQAFFHWLNVGTLQSREQGASPAGYIEADTAG